MPISLRVKRPPAPFLLPRKHLQTGQVAYHDCHVPPGRTVPLMTLVRVACLRWPVEEDFGVSGFAFGECHRRELNGREFLAKAPFSSWLRRKL